MVFIKCMNFCTPGSSICIDNMLTTCDENGNLVTTDCPESTECSVKNKKMACMPDSKEKNNRSKKSKSNNNLMSDLFKLSKDKEFIKNIKKQLLEIDEEKDNTNSDENTETNQDNSEFNFMEQDEDQEEHQEETKKNKSKQMNGKDNKKYKKVKVLHGKNNKEKQKNNKEHKTATVTYYKAMPQNNMSTVTVTQTIIQKEPVGSLDVQMIQTSDKTIPPNVQAGTNGNGGNGGNKLSGGGAQGGSKLSGGGEQGANGKSQAGNSGKQAGNGGSKSAGGGNGGSKSAGGGNGGSKSAGGGNGGSKAAGGGNGGSKSAGGSKPAGESKPAGGGSKAAGGGSKAAGGGSKPAGGESKPAAGGSQKEKNGSTQESKPQQPSQGKDEGGSKPSKDKESGSQKGGNGEVNVTADQIMEAMSGQGFNPKQEYVDAVVTVTNEEFDDMNMATMFLAQLAHESGGFEHIEEIDCAGSTKCADQYGGSEGAPGKSYHGRGFIQLSWPANYKAAGEALGMGDELFQNPEMVAEDPELGAKVSAWFWKENVESAPGVSDNQFGATTKAINGALECTGSNVDKSKKRYEIYKALAEAFNITDLADEGGCY